MTTARFAGSAGPIARLRMQIYCRHCNDGEIGPAETQRGTLPCTKCKSSTPYTFSPSGAMQARCSAAGCPVRFDH